VADILGGVYILRKQIKKLLHAQLFVRKEKFQRHETKTAKIQMVECLRSDLAKTLQC
jgi:hypothetical protein